LHALFFSHAQVLSENTTDDGGWELEVELASREYERLRKSEQVLLDQWEPLATPD